VLVVVKCNAGWGFWTRKQILNALANAQLDLGVGTYCVQESLIMHVWQSLHVGPLKHGDSFFLVL
jgi:hypothetical protein